MESWSFLTNHARVLLCIAQDPGTRLRDIAATVGITERTSYGIVTDLSAGGYLVKDKNGRRNHYEIQSHLPLPEAVGRERTIGEVLALLVDASAYQGGSEAEKSDDPRRPRALNSDDARQEIPTWQ